MKYLLLTIVLFLGSCVTPGDLAEFTGTVTAHLEKVEQTQIEVIQGTATSEDLAGVVDDTQEAIAGALEDLEEAVSDRTEDWVGGIQGLTLPDVGFTVLSLLGMNAYRNSTRRRELKPVLEKTNGVS